MRDADKAVLWSERARQGGHKKGHENHELQRLVSWFPRGRGLGVQEVQRGI